MSIEKAYVNPDNRAVVTCPHCGSTTTVRVEKLRGPKRRVQIKCKCQSPFRVSFEFRKNRRKETHLPGYYVKVAAAEEWGEMVVRNISVTGIQFHIATTHNLGKGDKVRVRFTVDDMWVMLDREQTEIEREAVVRWSNDKQIGCEFTEPIGYDTVDAVSGFFPEP